MSDRAQNNQKIDQLMITKKLKLADDAESTAENILIGSKINAAKTNVTKVKLTH
jgi:hypothetical protein